MTIDALALKRRAEDFLYLEANTQVIGTKVWLKVVVGYKTEREVETKESMHTWFVTFRHKRPVALKSHQYH